MTKTSFLFRIEQKKLRYRKNGLILLAMLGIELLWSWYSFYDAAKHWYGMEYYGMLYQTPTLIVIFFPLTLAVLASRLCDMEHRGNNFKVLCTMEQKKQIYQIKVLEGLKYIFVLTISQPLFILLMGSLYHFAQPFPLDNMIFFTLEILIISISVFLIQLLLSLFIENQLIPLVIGLIGSFSGLFTLYVPFLRPFTIWGYYALLSPVEFWWNPDTRDYGAGDAPCNWVALIIFAGIALVLYLTGKYLFEKKEA